MSIAVGRQPRPRQQQILDAARNVLLERGFGDFSIERVADATGCSRPAVYRHFPCKEEIVLALAIESEQVHQGLRERALLFDGRPRERAIAVGMIVVVLFPRHVVPKLLATSPAIRHAKTSRERREELRILVTRGVSSDAGLVREAVVAGDLVLPDGMTYQDVFFGSWSAFWGAMSFMRSDLPLQQMGFGNPESALLGSLVAMVDGLGWRPLSTEWDYNKTIERIATEVFPPEVVSDVGGRQLGHVVLPKMPVRTPAVPSAARGSMAG